MAYPDRPWFGCRARPHASGFLPFLSFPFPGEAYEALVSFLDEKEPSWRSSLRQGMTKAVRWDGKVRVPGAAGFSPPNGECVVVAF